MAAARWHITHAAVARYVHLRRWPDDDRHRERAELELLARCDEPGLRGTDAEGRQLWRSPDKTGGGLRWVIDPRPHRGGTLPSVIWVGNGRPPTSVWTPAEREPEPPKRGRPPIESARDLVLRMRATAADLDRWQCAADADQRTLSDWARRALDRAAEPRRGSR